MSDCQWIQYLHSVGLLKASFRPPDEVWWAPFALEATGESGADGSEHIMHMQKALSEMNLQLHLC
jgi:transposase